MVQLAQRQSGDTIRILSGITEGERVATTNLGPLYDTAEVRVIEGAAAAAAPAGKGHAEAR